MDELRWILLLIGLVFLALLAGWETHRSWRARRELSEPSASGPAHGEPELGHLPEEFAARGRPAADTPGMGRVSNTLPPIVELPPLDAEDATDAVLPAYEADIALEADAELDPTADTAEQAPPPEWAESAKSAESAQYLEPDALTEQAEQTEQAHASVAAHAQESPSEPAPLTVEWPPEGERQIIALRIMAASEQRLSGRTARQALAANGFVHGRYGIFHQPGADGRALLSCASMSKPGIFDLASMDFQRFAGLSLFMVLPGPLPAEVALDRLLETGWELAQRLQALLQDEQGRTLDEGRVEEMRNSVRENSTGTMGAQPAEPAA